MAEGFITRRGGVGGEVAPTYIAATGGTTNTYTENGKNYKSHTFTSSGTFTITQLGNVERNKLDYLIVAGGGSGGSGGGLGEIGRAGGGGGAGGYLTTVGTSGGGGSPQNQINATINSYNVIVGAGGSDSNGNNSSVFGVTAIGGGKGGRNDAVGSNGGSGGGGGGNGRDGGVGTNGQGFNGSINTQPLVDTGDNFQVRMGGAGGGAGSPASFRTLNEFPNDEGRRNSYRGGAGLPNTIRNGNVEFYGGGGGVGARLNNGMGLQATLGGIGGGGSGKLEEQGEAGQQNTGGGGGSAGSQHTDYFGGNGGSGIVIIRYEVA